MPFLSRVLPTYELLIITICQSSHHLKREGLTSDHRKLLFDIIFVSTFVQWPGCSSFCIRSSWTSRSKRGTKLKQKETTFPGKWVALSLLQINELSAAIKRHWTQIACKVGFHVSRLYSRMSFIYKYKTFTYPLCKTMRCTYFSRTKHILRTIRFYVQSGVDF